LQIISKKRCPRRSKARKNTQKMVSESFHLYEKKLGLNSIDFIHFLL